MANPPALPTESQQPLSIRRLSTERLEETLTPKERKRLSSQTVLQRLAYVCQKVMRVVNAKLQEKAAQGDSEEDKGLFKMVVEKPGVGHGFNFLCYARQIPLLSKFARSLVQMGAEETGLQTARIETICFLFRTHSYLDPKGKKGETKDDVYALTSSDAWRRVAHLTDYEFPHAVLMRLLETKVNNVAYQPLVGNALRGEKDFKEPEELPLTRYFDKFVTHITSRIRPQASIYRLEAFCNKGGKIPKTATQVKIEMGAVRFQKQLALADYPPLLAHLSKIHHGQKTHLVKVGKSQKIMEENGAEEKDREELAFWKNLKPVDPEEAEGLEDVFDQALWRAFHDGIVQPIFFVHRFVKDYATATSFRLVSRLIPREHQKKYQWDSPKSAQEILKLLHEIIPKDNCTNGEALSKFLKEIKIEFKTAKGVETSSLRKMFGGEIRITETQKSYFRVGGQWLSLSVDYLRWVHAKFRELLDDCLIKPGDPRNLSHPWPSEKEIEKAKEKNKGAYAENIYNCSYIDEKGFLVGDRVIVEKIELFDLLRRISEGVSDEILLYHVKKTFGQQTRDAASQIRVSKTLLHAQLSDATNRSTWLDTLFDNLEKEYPGCLKKVGGKKDLIKAFERTNITYVYAVYDDSSRRTLADELSRKEDLTVDDFAHLSIKSKTTKQWIAPQAIIEALEEEGYLDEEGKLKPRFDNSTQQEFKDEMSGHLDCTKVDAEILFKHMRELAVSPYNSLIARLELLKLREQVEKKGFKFRICQIPRPEDAQAVQADSSGANAVLMSPVIPKSRKTSTLVEGSEFTYETQKYQIENTVPDGTCGLYAAFGTPSAKGYFCDGGAKQARNSLAEDLKGCLNENNAQVLQAYQTFILSLLIGKSAKRTNGKFFAGKLRAPAAQYLKRAQQLEEKHQEAVERLESELLKTHKKMKEGSARNYSALEKILGSASSEKQLKKAFHEKREALREFFCDEDFPKTYNAPAKHFAEIEKLDGELEELKNEILADDKVLEAYLKCIKDPDYWFETEELCLAGLVRKQPLRIFIQKDSGTLEIADEVLVDEAENLEDIRTVFHRGNHFMRCTPLPEDPAP